MFGYVTAVQASSTLGPWQTFIIGVVVALVAAKVVQVLMLKLMNFLVRRTEFDWEGMVFDKINTPIYVTVAIVGLYIATRPLDLSAGTQFQLRAVLLSIITVIWVFTILKGGKTFFDEIESSSRFDHDFIPIFENLYIFITLIIAAGALLTIWNIDITPLLASAGIAGIAVGFAAKDTVANFFGGIALYFDKTYKVGDYIVLDSGESGTVVDVGVRSTRLRMRDDVIITVPNSVLNSSRIINESMPQTMKRITIPVGVAYGSDIDKVEEVLQEVAEEEEYVIDRPNPRPRFRSFGDSALQYELQCWIENPLHDINAYHHLHRKIYKRFNEEGIQIPFPQRDVHKKSGADPGESTVKEHVETEGEPRDGQEGADDGEGEGDEGADE